MLSDKMEEKVQNLQLQQEIHNYKVKIILIGSFHISKKLMDAYLTRKFSALTNILMSSVIVSSEGFLFKTTI